MTTTINDHYAAMNWKPSVGEAYISSGGNLIYQLISIVKDDYDYDLTQVRFHFKVFDYRETKPLVYFVKTTKLIIITEDHKNSDFSLSFNTKYSPHSLDTLFNLSPTNYLTYITDTDTTTMENKLRKLSGDFIISKHNAFYCKDYLLDDFYKIFKLLKPFHRQFGDIIQPTKEIYDKMTESGDWLEYTKQDYINQANKNYVITKLQEDKKRKEDENKEDEEEDEDEDEEEWDE
jgi:hypothetical protein